MFNIYCNYLLDTYYLNNYTSRGSVPWLSATREVGLKGWRVVSMASMWAGTEAAVSGLAGAGLSSDTDTYWHTEPGLPEPSDLVAYTGPVLLAV